MTFTMRTTVLALALLTAGCGTVQWYKPGASDAEVARDLERCRSEAGRQSFEEMHARAAARPYSRDYDALGHDTLAPRMSDEGDRVMVEQSLLRNCMARLGYQSRTVPRK
jgi:hypothetical protein